MGEGVSGGEVGGGAVGAVGGWGHGGESVESEVAVRWGGAKRRCGVVWCGVVRGLLEGV
jgi:hypothetical protein